MHKCVTMSLCEWVEGRRVESLEIRKLPGEGVGAGGLGWQGRWGGGGREGRVESSNSVLPKFLYRE